MHCVFLAMMLKLNENVTPPKVKGQEKKCWLESIKEKEREKKSDTYTVIAQVSKF